MATSFEYSRQARTYDQTRAATPSVLAADGWAPVVVDRNPAMLARAARWR